MPGRVFWVPRPQQMLFPPKKNKKTFRISGSQTELAYRAKGHAKRLWQSCSLLVATSIVNKSHQPSGFLPDPPVFIERATDAPESFPSRVSGFNNPSP